MSNDVYGYSVTAASNTSNFPENQAPSTVNDGARDFQAAIAAYRNQLDTTCTVGGTSDAITLTYSPTFSSVVQNQVHTFIAGATSTTTTPTLSVDGLTARTIVKDDNGTALLAGDIQQYRIYTVIYDLANTRWVLVNPFYTAAYYYADGTITTAKISKSFSGGSTSPASGASWTPAAGEYNYTVTSNGLRFDIYVSSAWRPGNGYVHGGSFKTDGTNMRINDAGVGGVTIYYQSFA